MELNLSGITLITIGFICLLGCLASVIFTIIYFAGNKPGRYGWLSVFFVCFTGLILCVFFTVQKAVNKVTTFTQNQISGFADQFNALDTLSTGGQDNRDYILNSNEEIMRIKSYLPDTLKNAVPEQFYTYFGFLDYYRFPITYPYSIHCIDKKENGELFNEKDVFRFDESDNGEFSCDISGIKKIGFDNNLLLIELEKDSNTNNNENYLLFEFGIEKVSEFNSLKDLFFMAKKKGYKGHEPLLTIKEYDDLLK